MSLIKIKLAITFHEYNFVTHTLRFHFGSVPEGRHLHGRVDIMTSELSSFSH